jgi:hypothetical protein
MNDSKKDKLNKYSQTSLAKFLRSNKEYNQVTTFKRVGESTTQLTKADEVKNQQKLSLKVVDII